MSFFGSWTDALAQGIDMVGNIVAPLPDSLRQEGSPGGGAEVGGEGRGGGGSRQIDGDDDNDNTNFNYNDDNDNGGVSDDGRRCSEETGDDVEGGPKVTLASRRILGEVGASISGRRIIKSYLAEVGSYDSGGGGGGGDDYDDISTPSSPANSLTEVGLDDDGDGPSSAINRISATSVGYNLRDSTRNLNNYSSRNNIIREGSDNSNHDHINYNDNNSCADKSDDDSSSDIMAEVALVSPNYEEADKVMNNNLKDLSFPGNNAEYGLNVYNNSTNNNNSINNGSNSSRSTIINSSSNNNNNKDDDDKFTKSLLEKMTSLQRQYEYVSEELDAEKVRRTCIGNEKDKIINSLKTDVYAADQGRLEYATKAAVLEARINEMKSISEQKEANLITQINQLSSALEYCSTHHSSKSSTPIKGGEVKNGDSGPSDLCKDQAVWYMKGESLDAPVEAVIIACHNDNPPDTYYTVRFHDGREKQTDRKYIYLERPEPSELAKQLISEKNKNLEISEVLDEKIALIESLQKRIEERNDSDSGELNQKIALIESLKQKLLDLDGSWEGKFAIKCSELESNFQKKIADVKDQMMNACRKKIEDTNKESQLAIDELNSKLGAANLLNQQLKEQVDSIILQKESSDISDEVVEGNSMNKIELQQLKTEFAARESQSRLEWDSKLAIIEAEAATMKSLLAQNDIEIERLKAIISEKDGELLSSAKSLTAAAVDVPASSSEQIVDLENKLQEEISKVLAISADLEQKDEEKRDVIKAFERTIADNEVAYRKKMTEDQNIIDSISTQLRESTSLKESLETKINMLNEKMTSKELLNREQQDVGKESIFKLEKENKNLRVLLDQHQKKRKSTQEESESIHAEREEYKAKLSELTSQINQLLSQNSLMSSSLNSSKAELDRLASSESELAVLRNSYSEAVQLLDHERLRSSQLEREMYDFKRKSEDDTSDMLLVKQDLALKQQELDNLNEAINHLEHQKTFFDKKLKEAIDRKSKEFDEILKTELKKRDIEWIEKNKQADQQSKQWESLYKDEHVLRRKAELETSQEKKKMQATLENAIAQLRNTQTDVIDRSVIASLLVSYFERNRNKDVLELICKILQLTEEQLIAIGLKARPTNLFSNIGSGLLKKIVGDSQQPLVKPETEFKGDNLAELWVNFLQHELDSSASGLALPAESDTSGVGTSTSSGTSTGSVIESGGNYNNADTTVNSNSNSNSISSNATTTIPPPSTPSVTSKTAPVFLSPTSKNK